MCAAAKAWYHAWWKLMIQGVQILTIYISKLPMMYQICLFLSLSLSLSLPNNICSIYLIKHFLIILKNMLTWVKALLLHILGSQIQTLAWWLVSISPSKQMPWSNSYQTAATSLQSLSNSLFTYHSVLYNPSIDSKLHRS